MYPDAEVDYDNHVEQGSATNIQGGEGNITLGNQRASVLLDRLKLELYDGNSKALLW